MVFPACQFSVFEIPTFQKTTDHLREKAVSFNGWGFSGDTLLFDYGRFL